MPNTLINNNFYQGTSDACIVDLTPPTFSGISSLDVESRGQIRAGWSAATDPTAPIRYEIYIKASTATGLFNLTNIVALTPNLQYDIFTLPDGSFLQNGVIYYVGIRAIDGVNNRDNNTASISVVSTGILTAIDTYETKAAWSVDDSNQFRITLWANKNESLAIPPDAILGTASYQIFNKTGTAIVGMSGSGIAANADGLFVATAVTNLLDEDREHYEARVTVSVDGEDRVNYIRMEAGVEVYNLDGIGDINDSGQIIGSFWASNNERVLTTGLGLGSYVTYTSSGTIIPGLSQSGITADVNGFYVITPLGPLPLDITAAYVVKLTAVINGQTRTKQIILGNELATFTNKATFSINASNQLEATFWALKNNVLVDPVIVTTASYQVYDKNGVAVVGLNQSGITADANGFFHITPVSAALISDLTHYTTKVTINVAGQDRTTVKGFTLLGT